MSNYKLQYFDARGVVETCRFLFAIAKVEYEDARFPFSFGTPGDFSTIKRPEFDASKASGELAASAGKVPYLEVDGVKFGQSKAIERYLAKKFGFAGSNDEEGAQIDALCEMVRDIKDAYNNAKRGKEGDEKEAALKTWFGETLPAQVKLMEGMVPGGASPSLGCFACFESFLSVQTNATSKGPFLFGAKISLADVAIFQFLASEDGFFDNTEGAAASFKSCPKIASAMAAVAAIPEVQAWIEKRPKTMF